MDPNKDAPGSDIQRLRSTAGPKAKHFSQNAVALANDVARAVLAFQRKNHRYAHLRAEIFDVRAFVISGFVAVVASLSLSFSLAHEMGFGPKPGSSR